MDALHTIARNLTKKRQTVSCAESCTGGMLAAAFTSVAGSSQWFDQSFVTYSNKAKEYRLGVLPETLLEHGAVSRQTVYEMARGAKAVAQADTPSVFPASPARAAAKANPSARFGSGLPFRAEVAKQCAVLTATANPSARRRSPSRWNGWPGWLKTAAMLSEQIPAG